jgi:hypothetical protein
MDTLTFKEVVKMARENDLHILIRSEGYALCDDQLETLVITSSLRKLVWYINNCEILGIIKV